MKIPELLCPAGTLESFKAAVDNGADAVYFGGKDFNARNAAANFSDEEIVEAVDYAHAHGAKANITLNTLYKDVEIQRLLEFAEKLYVNGADAFILQDIGVFSKIKEYMPGIQLHASTQMTIHSLSGAKFMEAHGFDRVVLSRELSLDEVEQISNNIHIETEVFIHGALCVCYSGQCIMSSHIGGRSGNRGRCAQPCRQLYTLEKEGHSIKSGYLLSPRDMINLQNITALTNAGISTLKIEGRMKSAEYVAIVTKAYREQLDRVKIGDDSVDDDQVKAVTQIFNRGGSSTSGYYFNYAGNKMMSVETPKSTGLYLGKVHSYVPPKEKGLKGRAVIRIEGSVVAGDGIEIWTKTKINAGGYVSNAASFGDDITVYTAGDISVGDKVYKSLDKGLLDAGKNLLTQAKSQLEINCEIKAYSGMPIQMKLEHREVCVNIEADIVQKAENQPMTEEKITKQMSKTGSTPYKLNFTSMDIGSDIYLPVSVLNEIRRNCIDEFHAKYINSFKRDLTTRYDSANESRHAEIKQDTQKNLTAQVCNIEQMKSAVNAGVSRVYLKAGFSEYETIVSASDYCQLNGAELYIVLPRIARTYDEDNLRAFVKLLEDTTIIGYLVSTYGQLNIIGENSKKKIITDYSFNVFNGLSYDFFENMGITPTISTELTIDELKDFKDGELIVEGHLPVMVTNQCPVGLYAAGKEEGKFCKLKNNSSSYSMVDKTAQSFPIITDCENCYALILNGPRLTMLNKFNEINKTECSALRLLFWEEQPEEVFETVMNYIRNLEGKHVPEEKTGITYGHFFRGVQ